MFFRSLIRTSFGTGPFPPLSTERNPHGKHRLHAESLRCSPWLSCSLSLRCARLVEEGAGQPCHLVHRSHPRRGRTLSNLRYGQSRTLHPDWLVYRRDTHRHRCLRAQGGLAVDADRHTRARHLCNIGRSLAHE